MRRAFQIIAQLLPFALIGYVVYDQLRRPPDKRTWTGNILFIPYDFSLPTPAKIRDRWWNARDYRVLTPHVFGIGWSINLYEAWQRVLDLVAA